MPDKKQTKWLDRHLVTHPDDINKLEQHAAELEFSEKMPRHHAEAKAYDSYVKEQHGRAAAHHLRGLKAAQATGDTDEARKHSAIYELHAKALGFDPWSEAPAELARYMHEEKPEAAHKFKSHRGDLLAVEKHKEEVSKAETQATLGRILKKAELALLLKGDVVPFPKDRVTPKEDKGKDASVSTIHTDPHKCSTCGGDPALPTGKGRTCWCAKKAEGPVDPKPKNHIQGILDHVSKWWKTMAPPFNQERDAPVRHDGKPSGWDHNDHIHYGDQ